MKRLEHFFKLCYYRTIFLRRMERKHQQLVKAIAQRGYANVIFIASNLSMWRYQGIYELMKQDSRFKPTILLVPFLSYSDKQKAEDIKALKLFFDSNNIPYEDTTAWSADKFAIREWLNPDIMFYPQQYSGILDNSLDSSCFIDKLLCFAPYGVGSVSEQWALNSRFQNIAWRLFYETEIYHDAAKRFAFNRGKNVVVVGNTNADMFLRAQHDNPWKQQSSPKKKVIWAPHFTIEQDRFIHRSGFLLLHDVMLNIAKQYSDTIQFTFKPHPRLKSILYEFPEWGKERTDQYYEKWATMPNTQLEEAAFYDLFMTSDALIHDCVSFTVEYHYSKNPCLFIADKTDEIRKQLNELGTAALDAHYLGSNENDIRHFLDETVLSGIDPKKQEREHFFNKYLSPPNGKTTAQNIYDNIVNSIWK